MSVEEAERLVSGYYDDMEAMRSDPDAWAEELALCAAWGMFPEAEEPRPQESD